jgi:hypothetical protein
MRFQPFRPRERPIPVSRGRTAAPTRNRGLPMRIVLPAALAASLVLAPQLHAQPSAAELLERCQRGYQASGREVHCELRDATLPAGALRLDGGQNGPVTIRAHEGRGILVRAVVHAHAPDAARARQIAAAVRLTTQGTVSATGPRTGEREGWSIAWDVLVPARTDLDVEAHNGPLTATGVTGTLRLRTGNGPLTLDRLGGDVEARAQNGPIVVTLHGARWIGAGLSAETVNGPLTVRMPADYAATLRGGTRHGPISVAFPGVVTGNRGVGGTLEGAVNGGGPTLQLRTQNGPLRIARS